MITFIPRFSPLVAPVPRSSRDDDLRLRVEERFGEVAVSPDVDYEEWTESSLRLLAVLDEGVACRVIWPDGEVRFGGRETPDALLGYTCPYLEREAEMGLPPRPSIADPSRYAETEIFYHFAGRDAFLCNVPGEPAPFRSGNTFSRTGSGIPLDEAEMKFAGGECFIKRVLPSKAEGPFAIEVPANAHLDQANSFLPEDFRWSNVRFEGDQNAILVQGHLNMTRETRFFVINGELVSGAACVEDHTPLDRPDGDGVIVSDLYEERRNSGKMVIDPATSAALLELAGRFVSEMSAEEPLMLNYSLDLAMTRAGPVVIELNPANDSGLYANDAGAIMRAELRQVELKPELVGEVESPSP